MIRFAVIIAVLLFESESAWTSPLPTFDLQATCRRAALLISGSEKSRYRACLSSETDARKEMTKTWSTFKSGAQVMCARTTRIGGSASYVELLTCLQLDQQGAAASLENKKALTLQQRVHPPLTGAAKRSN